MMPNNPGCSQPDCPCRNPAMLGDWTVWKVLTSAYPAIESHPFPQHEPLHSLMLTPAEADRLRARDGQDYTGLLSQLLFQCDHPLWDEKLLAACIQVCGIEREERCARCERGLGTWLKCVGPTPALICQGYDIDGLCASCYFVGERKTTTPTSLPCAPTDVEFTPSPLPSPLLPSAHGTVAPANSSLPLSQPELREANPLLLAHFRPMNPKMHDDVVDQLLATRDFLEDQLESLSDAEKDVDDSAPESPTTTPILDAYYRSMSQAARAGIRTALETVLAQVTNHQVAVGEASQEAMKRRTWDSSSEDPFVE
ncbi:hypothetical protein F5Y13DRAFT_165645 [Hypoxylon sp. FL1857]|nr:hypothetical protein F5Y13DRAFT_165645 [Hypoxylon sp. FL1857]